jgi:hypothetical protein
MSRNSSTPSWAFFTVALWVSTTMPSATGLVQAVTSIGPARSLHLHQAHPAHAHRLHAGVPAEARDVGAVILGRLDDQLPGRHLELSPVDRDPDRSLMGAAPLTVDVGHHLVAEVGGDRDDRRHRRGPSGQIVVILPAASRGPPDVVGDVEQQVEVGLRRPARLEDPLEDSLSQVVPSRHGVHWPQDSWAKKRTRLERRRHHTGGLVHHHHRPRAEHRAMAAPVASLVISARRGARRERTRVPRPRPGSSTSGSGRRGCRRRRRRSTHAR